MAVVALGLPEIPRRPRLLHRRRSCASRYGLRARSGRWAMCCAIRPSTWSAAASTPSSPPTARTPEHWAQAARIRASATSTRAPPTGRPPAFASNGWGRLSDGLRPISPMIRRGTTVVRARGALENAGASALFPHPCGHTPTPTSPSARGRVLQPSTPAYARRIARGDLEAALAAFRQDRHGLLLRRTESACCCTWLSRIVDPRCRCCSWIPATSSARPWTTAKRLAAALASPTSATCAPPSPTWRCMTPRPTSTRPTPTPAATSARSLAAGPGAAAEFDAWITGRKRFQAATPRQPARWWSGPEGQDQVQSPGQLEQGGSRRLRGRTRPCRPIPWWRSATLRSAAGPAPSPWRMGRMMRSGPLGGFRKGRMRHTYAAPSETWPNPCCRQRGRRHLTIRLMDPI